VIQDEEATRVLVTSLEGFTSNAVANDELAAVSALAGRRQVRRRIVGMLSVAAVAFAGVSVAAVALNDEGNSTRPGGTLAGGARPTLQKPIGLAPPRGCEAVIPTISLNGELIVGGSEPAPGTRYTLSQSQDAHISISRGELPTGTKGPDLKDVSAQLLNDDGSAVASGQLPRGTKSSDGGNTVAMTIAASMIQQIPTGNYYLQLSTNQIPCSGVGFASSGTALPITIAK
jgi:hypothetical protein